MSKNNLSKDEQKLLDAVESGQFESVLNDKRRAELKAVAGHTSKKDKRINVRISNRDFLAIQSKALQQGIPYQTLVSSIIHKYISGSLKDLTINHSKNSIQDKHDCT